MKIANLGEVKVLVLLILVVAGFSISSCGKSSIEDTEMRDASARINWEDVSKNYISKNKSWSFDEYDLEYVGENNGSIIVLAKFKQDETMAYPGGGRSIEIHIDSKTGDVVGEFGFQ